MPVDVYWDMDKQDTWVGKEKGGRRMVDAKKCRAGGGRAGVSH